MIEAPSISKCFLLPDPGTFAIGAAEFTIHDLKSNSNLFPAKQPTYAWRLLLGNQRIIGVPVARRDLEDALAKKADLGMIGIAEIVAIPQTDGHTLN